MEQVRQDKMYITKLYTMANRKVKEILKTWVVVKVNNINRKEYQTNRKINLIFKINITKYLSHQPG